MKKKNDIFFDCYTEESPNHKMTLRQVVYEVRNVLEMVLAAANVYLKYHK